MKIAIRVANTSSGPSRLILEPYGREYELALGQDQRFDFEGPDEALVDVELRDGGIVVYGWVGSTVDDGAISPGPPVPAIPPGMDVRGFVELMFGGTPEPPR